MKIKEQTRKLAAGCSKHSFEVVDKTDEVSYPYLRPGDVDAVWKYKTPPLNYQYFQGGCCEIKKGQPRGRIYHLCFLQWHLY